MGAIDEKQPHQRDPLAMAKLQAAWYWALRGRNNFRITNFLTLEYSRSFSEPMYCAVSPSEFPRQ